MLLCNRRNHNRNHLSEAWLGTYAKRVKITVDNTNIDSDLTHFPVPIVLGDGVGQPTITDVDDDFTGTDGDPPDTDLWNEQPNVFEIQGNKLRATVNSTYDIASLSSVYELEGDFDLQVDMDKVTWSTSDGWQSLLEMYFDGDSYFRIGRRYNSGNVHYARGKHLTVWDPDVLIATTMTACKYRVKRVGTTLTGYYWSGSAWTLYYTHTVVTLNCTAKIKQQTFIGYPTTVTDFDNFTVNSGTLVWPAGEGGKADLSEIFDDLEYSADDDFTGTDGDAPDAIIWDQSEGASEIQSNKLQQIVTQSATITTNTLLSKFKLTGNFDVQIDFTHNFPSSNFSTLYFMIYSVDVSNYVVVQLVRSATFWKYSSWKKIAGTGTQVGVDTTTTDVSETLRFVQANGTISVIAGASTLGSLTDFVNTTEFNIRIQTYNGTDYPLFQVDWDNFLINSADKIIWPDGEPNRKKIAITKYDGVSQIYGEIETWDSSAEKAVIHVSKSDLDITTASDTELYIYWDSAQSDNTTYIGASGSTVAQSVYPSNVVMNHNMADATTSTLLDSTSNNFDGTKQSINNPVQADGLIGKAQNFSSDEVVIPDNTDFDLTGDFTVEAFLNVDTVAVAGAVVSKFWDGSNRAWHFAISSSENFGLLMRDPAESVDTVVSSANGSIVAGSWVYCALRNDGTDYQAFIDGLSSGASAAKKTMDTNNAAVNFGDFSHPTTHQYFDGKISLIKITNASLSDAWIKAMNYALTDDLLTFSVIESYSVAYVPLTSTIVIASSITSSIDIGVNVPMTSTIVIASDTTSSIDIGVNVPMTSTVTVISDTTSSIDIEVPWLGTYAKRIKITVDNTNIDSDLTHFPVPIVLGTSVGQSSQDLSEIFDDLGLTYPVDDDFTGTDGDAPNPTKWDTSLSTTGDKPEIQSNKCKFNAASGGTAPGSSKIISLFKFTGSGDFSFEMDIDLNQPASNSSGMYFRLVNADDDTDIAYIYRRKESALDEWRSGQIIAGSQTGLATTTTYVAATKVRLTRESGVIKTYLYTGTWSLHHSISGYSEFQGDLIIDIEARSFSGYPGIEADIDNFTINSADEITWTAGEPNRKKIAITKDDGVSQIYGEIETWDSSKAVIHVAASDLDIISSAVTELYLYWDSSQDDNDNYIGDTGVLNTVTNITGDDFTGPDGDTPNTDLWNTYFDSKDSGDSSGVISIQGNELDFALATITCPVVQSNFKLSGDFDIQVDFGMDVTPPGDIFWSFGMCIGSENTAILTDPNYAFIARYEMNGSFGPYRSGIVGGSTAQGGSTDLSGKFRFVRTGSSLHLDYWNGSSWTVLNTSTTYGTHDVYVKLYARLWGVNVLNVNFDNFLINSGTVTFSPSERVWDDNFKAVYHMAQDPSGTAPQVLDSTDNSNDGTSSGSMTSGDLVDGRIGKAIDLDGVDDFIDIGDTTALDGATSFTLEWSGKLTSIINQSTLIRKWAPGQQSFSFNVLIPSTNELEILVNDATQVDFLQVDSTNASLVADTEYILTGVWNGANSVSIYKDGVALTTNTVYNNNQVSVYNSTEHLGIGARYKNGTPDFFNVGAFREIRISNSVRSADWIKATNYALTDDLLTFNEVESYSVAYVPMTSTVAVISDTTSSIDIGVNVPMTSTIVIASDTTSSIDIGVNVPMTSTVTVISDTTSSIDIEVPWLGTYAKRIKITVDNTNIDADLTHFPISVVLGTSVGQSSQDLSEIFDDLTYPVNDDFTGTDGDVPNEILWKPVEFVEATGSAVIASNKLHVVVTGNNAAPVDEVNLTILLQNPDFAGDFSFEVQFSNLVVNKEYSGFEVFTYLDENNNSYVKAGWYDAFGKYWSSKHINAGAVTAGTTISRTNDSGSIFIERVGTTLTSYYKDGAGSKTQINTSTYTGSPIQIKLQMMDFQSDSGSASVDIDDFIITGTALWTEGEPNRKKIAITKDDGVSQIYGEIETWDSSKAVIHVAKSDLDIISSAVTELYLYFDPAQDNNDNYIGDTGVLNTVTNITGDDFTGTDGDAPNPDLWINIGDEDAVINNNKLRLESSGGSASFNSCGVDSKWEFGGTDDFDVQFDITEILTISASGAAFQFDLISTVGVDYARILLIRDGASRLLRSKTVVGGVIVDSYDISNWTFTALRVTRVSGILTTYYYNGSWVIHKVFSDIPVLKNNLKVFLKVGSWTSYPAMTFDIDNFLINSGTVKFSPSERVWDSNFKAVYHMAQDPSGTAPQMLDSTLNNNDGTSSGSMTSGDLVDGVIGKAIYLDGVDDSINCGSDSVLDNIFSGGGSAIFVINADSWGESNYGRLFFKGESGTNNSSTQFYINGDIGNEWLSFFRSNAGSWNSPIGSISLSTDIIVAVTYNEDAQINDPLIYIDGVSQILTQLDTAFPADTDADYDLIIGARGSDRNFDGTISKAIFLDSILTPAWIKATNYALTDDLLTFNEVEQL